MLHHGLLALPVCLLLFFIARLTATSVTENFAPPNNVHELSGYLRPLGFSIDGGFSGAIASTSNDRTIPGQASCSRAVSNPPEQG